MTVKVTNAQVRPSPVQLSPVSHASLRWIFQRCSNDSTAELKSRSCVFRITVSKHGAPHQRGRRIWRHKDADTERQDSAGATMQDISR